MPEAPSKQGAQAPRAEAEPRIEETEEVFDRTIRELKEEQERAPRFPVRWRFALFVGLAVMVAVGILLVLILQFEREAWLESQREQARVHVGRLADELKIPMLAGFRAEIDVIAGNFLKNTPSAVGLHIRMADGQELRYGQVDASSPLAGGQRVQGGGLWYRAPVVYGGTKVGEVAVRFSEEAWKARAARLARRIVAIGVLVIVLAMAGVLWIAGRLSEPLEELARAARAVAYGDYTVRLPITGNDEINDAIAQFNAMVAELRHKEELRDVFGRYLNPKLVSEVFDQTAPQAAMRSERREVSVLFADMVNFTAFSESTDTSQVIEVLNQHFEVFHRIIDYYGGVVDKYIGDAVMAVFNHPKDDPAHPRSAVKAALAMVAACRRLGVLRPDGKPIQFRVGINCGEVIVGPIGAERRLEYTVIGDTVNIASRLAGLGEGGQVVITRKTFARVGEGFRFVSLGEKRIKGISKPVECGIVEAEAKEVRDQLRHAVALALDLTLPSGLRELVGEDDA